jgi:hypothetical protein
MGRISIFAQAFGFEGTIENSRAFQCRVGWQTIISPAGTKANSPAFQRRENSELHKFRRNG